MRKRILFKDEEISREIERRIEAGRLKEGARLPSERQLAGEFGVQRDTVRCAFEMLLKRGVVIKRPRQGYFVAPKKIEIDVNNFYAVMREIESIGSSLRSIVLSFEKVSMSKSLAEETGLPEGTLCYQILRIRYDSERPMSLERSYLIAEHVPGMKLEDLESKSLGSLLRKEYGITLISSEQRITQVYADDMEAELLRIGKDEPLIRYEGLVRDRKDRLIEFFDNVVLPGRIEFRIRDFA